MKRIVTPWGWMGPYVSVEKLVDRYLVNGGAHVPFVAIGGEGVVEDYDGPPYIRAEESTLILAENKARKTAEVRVKRDSEEARGFTHNGAVFDSDMASVLRLVTAGFAIQGGAPGMQISWTAKNGSVVPMTPAALKDAAGALVMRADAVHSRARALITAINAAADVDAVDAIDISTGWPA